LFSGNLLWAGGCFINLNTRADEPAACDQHSGSADSVADPRSMSGNNQPGKRWFIGWGIGTFGYSVCYFGTGRRNSNKHGIWFIQHGNCNGKPRK
jgi:hypothetical protein